VRPSLDGYLVEAALVFARTCATTFGMRYVTSLRPLRRCHPIHEFLAVREPEAIECLRVDEESGARRGTRGPTAKRPRAAL